jgi:hypothetical protein
MTFFVNAIRDLRHPEEAEGSHPPPQHQLYLCAAMKQRYKEAQSAVSKDAYFVMQHLFPKPRRFFWERDAPYSPG